MPGNTLSKQPIGKVVIGEGTVIEDSIIEDYVTIGSNVVLRKCRIGSYIGGDGSSVIGTDIRNSIIMEDCILRTWAVP